MGIGLGPDSYDHRAGPDWTDSQLRKPTDRRAIIEEAAGITKFKTKRRLSEAKLESSKINLSRINDIYVEVEKQLASLKRQASKARRYAEIREQMRGLLRQVLASNAKGLDLEADRLARLVRGISQQESLEAQSVNQWEAEQERLSSRTYELEGELRQHQNVLGQTALELDRSENRILFNKQRTAELTGRLQQLNVEIEQGAAQAAQVELRAAAHGESVTAIQGEVSRVEAILTNLVAATAEISGAHDSTEERIAALRRSAAELGEELTRLHGDQAQAEQTLAHHSARKGPALRAARNSSCWRSPCISATARKPPICTGNPSWSARAGWKNWRGPAQKRISRPSPTAARSGRAGRRLTRRARQRPGAPRFCRADFK